LFWGGRDLSLETIEGVGEETRDGEVKDEALGEVIAILYVNKD
jgi:hypothetical protein